MADDIQEIIEDMKSEYFKWLDSQIKECENSGNMWLRLGNEKMAAWYCGKISAFKQAKLMFHSKFS